MSEDKPQTQESAVVTTDSDGEAASNIVSLTSKMNNKQLQQATERMAKQREIIKKFVNDALVSGTDFGTIQGTTKSGGTFNSKPTLFKPGMEKIFSLFGLVTELERDSETLEMLSEQKNLVAFKCTVLKNGVKIAEGRGAATIGDMSRDANATIKIVEKRARMDACLSLGFSEFFTQDMEDPEYRNKVNGNSTPLQVNNPGGAVTAPAKKEDDGTPMSDPQRRMIYSLLKQAGADTDDLQKEVLTLNDLDPKKITKMQASDFISNLLKKDIKWPEVEEADEEETENE